MKSVWNDDVMLYVSRSLLCMDLGQEATIVIERPGEQTIERRLVREAQGFRGNMGKDENGARLLWSVRELASMMAYQGESEVRVSLKAVHLIPESEEKHNG